MNINYDFNVVNTILFLLLRIVLRYENTKNTENDCKLQQREKIRESNLQRN